MKKNHFKRAFLLGTVILFSSLLLWNCETEEDFIDAQNTTTQVPLEKIQRHQVPLESFLTDHYEAFQILTELTKEEPQLDGKSEQLYSDEHDLYYNLEEIYVIEGDTYEQFSFVVRSSDQLENQFKNYLLITYPNNEYQQFIITYEYDTSDHDTFHLFFVEELEGSSLLTRSAGCPFPQFAPVFSEVCSNYNCTGNNHAYGQGGCTCGSGSNCEPARRVCTIETTYTLMCGGGGSSSGDNDGSSDDPNNNNGQPGGGDQTGGGNSGDDEIPVIPIEEETAMDRILECMNTSSFNGPNVTMPQSLIDSLQLDSRCYAPLDNFIQDQGCDFESKSFAIDAARACLNGSKVNYDDKIILDTTFTNNQKAKCIYDNLMSSSTTFKKAIQKFEGDFPVSHLNFRADDLGSFIRGKTQAPDGAGNSPDYTITITINDGINTSGIEYRPNLMTVKTIAHEVIHAEMFRKLLSVLNSGGNIGDVTIPQVVSALSNGDYPGIYNYFRTYKNWQHQQMAAHYRETLARILQEYDTGSPVLPNQIPNQLYMDLAWEGLNKPTIQAWVELTPTERQRVDNIIDNYITNNEFELCN